MGISCALNSLMVQHPGPDQSIKSSEIMRTESGKCFLKAVGFFFRYRRLAIVWWALASQLSLLHSVVDPDPGSGMNFFRIPNLNF